MSDAMSTDNLRALAERATPGPWLADAPPITLDRTEDEWAVFAAARPVNSCVAIIGGAAQDEADAAYIAAANPQAILALLDERDDLAGDEALIRAERRDALAAERRATVERIRAAAVGPDDKTHDRILFVDDLERILDEEAARCSPERSGEG